MKHDGGAKRTVSHGVTSLLLFWWALVGVAHAPSKFEPTLATRNLDARRTASHSLGSKRRRRRWETSLSLRHHHPRGDTREPRAETHA